MRDPYPLKIVITDTGGGSGPEAEYKFGDIISFRLELSVIDLSTDVYHLGDISTLEFEDVLNDTEEPINNSVVFPQIEPLPPTEIFTDPNTIIYEDFWLNIHERDITVTSDTNNLLVATTQILGEILNNGPYIFEYQHPVTFNMAAAQNISHYADIRYFNDLEFHTGAPDPPGFPEFRVFKYFRVPPEKILIPTYGKIEVHKNTTPLIKPSVTKELILP